MQSNSYNLPNGWSLTNVETSCDILDNLRIPISEEKRQKRQGYTPYYGANGQQGWIDSHIFNEELILIAEDGGNFDNYVDRPIAYMIQGEAWVNNHAHVLRAKYFTTNLWVFYNLVHKNILFYIKGGTRAKLNQRELRAIEFPLPCSAEQKKITYILNTLDIQIQQTKQLIAKLNYIKTGFLQDLLTRGIDENGDVRDPVAHPEEFKKVFDGKLKIPFEWKVYPLAKVAELSSGVTLGRDLKGANTVELPYLRVANVQDGYLDLKEIKTIRVQKEEVNRFLLQPGDVLMTEGGDFDKLGRGTVWTGEISQCLHQNHIFKVRTNRHFLYPEFLALISRSSYGKQFFLLSSKQSTNLASINSTQLKAFPVPCPEKDEQERIVNVVNTQNMRIATEEANLNKLQQIKKGLMHDLLTGQVRVTHLIEDEEPPSV